MALVSMRQLLDHAAEFSYGLPAFNVNNLEQMRAIMEAADKCDAPVIVQASAGARKYAGAPFLRHLILAAVEEFPHIPVVMHQDHGTSPDVCQRSIQLGFSSVMMDGSLMDDGKTPSDYEYNARVTRQVVDLAHVCGVSVEGELGCLGSLETGHGEAEDGIGSNRKLSREELLTDPSEARRFVEATGVDALAIAIGTSHGAYKFKGEAKLDFDRLQRIGDKLPGYPLVLHGASSVPQEFVALCNQYGGKVGGAKGVPEDMLRKAAGMGVCKINVDTDIRLAVTACIRQYLAEHPEEFDPRSYLKPAREAVKKMVAHKIHNVMGSSGKA